MSDDLVKRLYRLPPPDTDRSIPQEAAARIEALTAERDAAWASSQAYKLDLANAEIRIAKAESDLAAARKVIEAADKAILHPLAVNCAAYYAARKGTTK